MARRRGEAQDSGAGPGRPMGPGVGGPGARAGAAPQTTHSTLPAGGFRGPLRCLRLRFPRWLDTRYYPPVIPTLVYPPGSTPLPAPGMSTRRRPRRSANTRSWTSVGEPRGVEYRGVSGGKPEHHSPYTNGCIQGPCGLLMTESSIFMRFPEVS